MTEHRFAEPKRHHLGKLLRRLRSEEIEGASALGVSAHRELVTVFDASPYKMAWFIDGEIAAIGGVVSSLAGGSGHLWIALSKLAQKYPRLLMAEGWRRFIDAGENKSLLETTVLRSDAAGLRFARAFGFRLKHPQRYSHLVHLEWKRDLPQSPELVSNERRPFVIYALPRSRTAWMANFLTYGGWQCGHEESMSMRTVDDIRRYFSQREIGAVDTAAAPGWRLIKHLFPAIRPVVIRRPVDDVIEILMGFKTIPYDRARLTSMLRYIDRLLDEIAAQPGVLTVGFDEIDSRAGEIFEHCLPFRFDRDWWYHTQKQDIQIDVPALMKYYADNRAAIENFKALCRREVVALCRAGDLRKVA